MSLHIDPISSISASQRTPSVANDAGLQPVTGIPYSDHAAGKTFSTHVQPVGDQYQGRIPNLPGASTTGDTVQEVEERLSNLISFFA
jgi:hypothetical protein